jgi:4-amino-4-deoxy-L-arabinose transferase-like glycosyltransferase
MNRHSKTILIGLLLVAFLHATVLFVIIPELSSHLDRFYNGNQYADGYEELASSLVSGNGYRFRLDTARTLMREPGYPILLAGMFLVFGKSFAAVKLANMLLALTAAYLVSRIAGKLSSSKVVVLGSPVLFLFHPGTLIAESRGGSEILFTCLLAIFILTVYTAFKSGRWWDYAVSGGVLGLTVLVRSTPILFPIVLLGYLLVFDREARPKKASVRNVCAMSLAMFVVLSPWIIRNYSLTGKFVPTASVVGVSAQTGWYLSTHQPISNQGVDREAAWERNRIAHELGYEFRAGYYQYFYSSTDEVEFSQRLLKIVIDEYKKSPVLFIKVIGVNLFNFWFGGRTWTSVALNAIVQVPLLVLAIMGIGLAVRQNQVKNIAPFGLLIVYIVGVSIPILALARYSVPLIPFVSILACMALVPMQKWLGRRGDEMDGSKVAGRAVVRTEPAELIHGYE